MLCPAFVISLLHIKEFHSPVSAVTLLRYRQIDFKKTFGYSVARHSNW